MMRPKWLRWTAGKSYWYPIFLGVIVAATAFSAGLHLPDPSSFLLGSTVTFGAIVSGFVGTALSILIGLDTPFMRHVNRTPYRFQIGSYTAHALSSGILLSLVGLAGLLFAPSSTWFAALWCGALAFCMVSLFRLARLMLCIFTTAKSRD